MDLRHLYALVAVLDAGTFAAAARLRRVAQPALWASVRGLEAEIGVSLFEREGRRVRPTPAAELLGAEARRVLDGAANWSSLAAELRAGRAAPARIGAAEYHVPYFLAGAIAALRRRWPDARVPTIVPVSAANASEVLRRREVDLVVAPRDPAARFRGAELYPVWLAAVGAGLVAGDLEVGLLAGRPVATFPEDTGVGRALAAAMASTGARLEVVHEHRSAASLLALAEHGVATAVLISEALPLDVERRAARLCAGGVPLAQELWLQWRDERTLPTAARQLRDVMLEEAERARLSRGSGRG